MSDYPKVFNKSKSHYAEIHAKQQLIYFYESKNNKLIEVYSSKELENMIKKELQ